MSPGAPWLLVIPLGLLLALGIGLLIAFRRSAPLVLLRLSAMFLGAWALLVTTALVWVLARGGLPGAANLLRDPGLLFQPSSAMIWIVGAIGALGVFASAFAINQLAVRRLLRSLHSQGLEWPSRLPAGGSHARLLRSDSRVPQAYAVALLRFRGHAPWGVYREETILVSDALLACLTPEELEATVAHELAHVRGFDCRYLTFLRTLALLVRWDPVVAGVAAGLTRHEEYRADDDASRITGNPRALATALLKLSEITPGGASGKRSLSRTVRRAFGRPDLGDRIQRLLAAAESQPRRAGDAVA